MERPGRRGVLLHGQGQHRLPLRDLAGHAARLRRARRPRRPARPARPAEPADRGGLERVPDHGGPQVLLLPRGGHLRQGLPGPLRRGRAALLRGRGRAGDPGHRLHLERVRPPQQRRAGRDLGQPGQPRGLVRGQEHRVHPGRPGAPDRPGPRAAGAVPAAFGTVGGHLAASRFKFAINEAMRTVAEANKYFSEQAPWKLREVRPGPDAHRAARGAAAGRRRQDAAHPVPAPLLPAGARDAGRHGHLVGHAAGGGGRRGGRPVLPGDHRDVRRHAALGLGTAAGRARRWPRPSRCSPSWTPRWWTRNWPGWAPDDSFVSRTGRGDGPGAARSAAPAGARQPHPPGHDRLRGVRAGLRESP